MLHFLAVLALRKAEIADLCDVLMDEDVFGFEVAG